MVKIANLEKSPFIFGFKRKKIYLSFNFKCGKQTSKTLNLLLLFFTDELN